MNNILEKGMVFKNARAVFTFLGYDYDSKHPARMYKRLSCYCEYHRDDKKQVIIDDIFENPNYSIYDKRNNNYIYNVGDIIRTNNSDLKIIKLARLTDKNRKGYICKCTVCNHEFPQVEYNLKNKIGCPVCCGKDVVIGVNDMWTTVPELAKLLLNTEDGYKYTQSSQFKVNWKCPICGEIINRSIANVKSRGFICSNCERTQSYPNRFMYNLLKYLDVEFENEKVFEWSKLGTTFKRYDFYIPSYGIIEMMGRQHYIYCNFHKLQGITLQDEINNDIFKKNLAFNNNINNYLQIDSRISSLKYIKNSILNSELANIYDLSKVDWEYIDMLSQKKVLNVISDLWNNGIYDIYSLKQKTGLSSGIITKYLKKCDEYKLIEYDKNKTKQASIKFFKEKTYQNKATPIMCIEKGLYFGSMQKCVDVMNEITGLKFSHGNINGVLNGRYTHHHKYTFKSLTREEFNNIKLQSPELAFGDFFILSTNNIK